MASDDLLNALLARRLPRSLEGTSLPRVREGAFPTDFDVSTEGYPSDEAIEQIGLIAGVDAARWMRDVFPPLFDDMPYSLLETESEHTALGDALRIKCSCRGWSGNESIIGAILSNFWLRQYLETERAGGHYVFVVPLRDPE